MFARMSQAAMTGRGIDLAHGRAALARLAMLVLAAIVWTGAMGLAAAPAFANYQQGLAQGERDGRSDGYKDGYVNAYKKSFRETLARPNRGAGSYSYRRSDDGGYAEGYRAGYAEGYEQGFRAGRRAGRRDGRDDAEDFRDNLRDQMRERCRRGLC
jgi:hypothetical protein